MESSVMIGPLQLGIGIAVTGAVITVLAAVLGWAVVPKVINGMLKKQLQLRNGTDLLEDWKVFPIPIPVKFYIYNVTNPDEFEAGGKPIIEETGPFIYNQFRTKHDVTQYDEYTIRYRDRKTFYFNPEMSGDKREDAVVNVINIPFVALVHGMRTLVPSLAPFIANTVLYGEGIIRRNVTVRELLFDGFDVSKFTESILGPILPAEFSNGTFGLYKTENGSNSKIFEIYTGVGNYGDLGRIRTYDGDAQMNYWKPGSPCDKIRGGDGTVFPPLRTKSSEFVAFSPDICRSMRFTYDSEQEFKGIKVYRFKMPKGELDHPSSNPNNECFCLEEKLEDCPKSGIMSLDGCGRAPIMMSFPHYMDADESFLNDTGLERPEAEKHESFLDVEPRTGATLQGQKRLQVNLLIQAGGGIHAYKDLTKDILLPLLWADESAEIEDDMVNDLKSKMLTPLKIIDIVKWAVLGVGIAVVIAGGVIFYIRRRRSKMSVV